MTAKQILDKYIAYFEKRGHKRIENAPLVPLNDPSTLFTSAGMQPLVPYLLGQEHPEGTRLVDVQNCFRAVDIDEIGDNRHTTFFRMLGNWSLGDYFKKEEIPWLFDFLIDPKEGLGLNPEKLYITVFAGNKDFAKDEESIEIWKGLFQTVNTDAKENERIFAYGVGKNWWSRSGTPEMMPAGEPGGPTTEVFYDFGPDLQIHEQSQWKNEPCHVNCDCGRYIEIGNSVFMQYIKQDDGTFANLPKQNVDFGGGLERLLAAANNTPDTFTGPLFNPIINQIEEQTKKEYQGENMMPMRIITDHFIAATFITANEITPSNKDQGYILRRLIRRAYDNFSLLGGKDLTPVLEQIVVQYKNTDLHLEEKFEQIKNTIVEETSNYEKTLTGARKFIQKKYKLLGDELMGVQEISANDAFLLYTTHGLSPTQIRSLGYTFNEQDFANLMEEHQKLSQKGAEKKFRGGLADHEELTIKGHTATHLLQQALRDVLGNDVHQTGSNITTERLRFDFNYPEKLSNEQIAEVEQIVCEKIAEDLPVHFEMLPLEEAKKTGAIGLFDDKYQEKVKVYFIGGSGKEGDHNAYSKEFCGGPHVNRTSEINSFRITKQEKLGINMQRLYAVVS